MREHHALWFAGRTARVNERCCVFGFDGICECGDQIRFAAAEFSAASFQISERDRVRRSIVRGVEKDDMLDRTAFSHRVFHTFKSRERIDEQHP